ncbi:class I SAM-dependent methyltransferase [Azospirillum tabaci]|uniref:class I SAM-dependent methyltransferase n=1 Tax=Azospirillum tabaci TaxID=2752310 RepID=UPI001B3BFB6D|nr:class I SAM-dependent methyltransferase [Azospirillum tabaci]
MPGKEDRPATPRLQNPIAERLASLGVIDRDAVIPYHPRVRDRDDVTVLRCTRSGVIFLARTDHMNLAHYEGKDGAFAVQDGDSVLTPAELDDSARRAADFGAFIRGRRWLDVGCGRGGVLDRLHSDAREAVGVEPNATQRGAATRRGLHVVGSLTKLGDRRFDTITLFHVFEHLLEPERMLADLRARLAPDGQLVIEVPHARDALLDLYDCEAFRRFTLWSEHLVLHTRESLEALVRAAGYTDVTITGYQRYPVANHLHWLRHGRPGGHALWSELAGEALHNAYAATLDALDRTDTLVAHVRLQG